MRFVWFAVVSFVIVDSCFAQHRIFSQLHDVPAAGTPLSGPVIYTSAGEVLYLDVYVEQAPPGTLLSGVQITMPCSVPCTISGEVYFNPPYLQNTERPDYCFIGWFCRAGTNIGLPCMNDAGCPGSPPGNDCFWDGGCFCVTDDGMCPIYHPRAATAVGIGIPGVVQTTPCNFGTFQYTVSDDAMGDCVLTIPNEPDSASRNQNHFPIPFVTSPVTFRIQAGQCCGGAACLSDMTRAACLSNGGFWNPSRTCADSCACSSTMECDDADACTFEQCAGGICQGQAVEFGDANASGGAVDMDDILCAIAGFANVAHCPNADVFPFCTGNNVINLDDVMRVVTAFGGADPCGCGG